MEAAGRWEGPWDAWRETLGARCGTEVAMDCVMVVLLYQELEIRDLGGAIPGGVTAKLEQLQKEKLLFINQLDRKIFYEFFFSLGW